MSVSGIPCILSILGYGTSGYAIIPIGFPMLDSDFPISDCILLSIEYIPPTNAILVATMDI